MPHTRDTTPAEQPRLAWKRGMDCCGFEALVEASRRNEDPVGLLFEINRTFLDAVKSMDNDGFDAVLRSLRSAPITMATLFTGFEGPAQWADHSFCGRLLLLFGVLGQLSTLKTFWFYFTMADMFHILIRAVERLQNVSFIDIYGLRTSDPWQASELGSALESHGSLEEIGLFVETTFYRSVLPKLRTIPTLRKVVLYPITEPSTTNDGTLAEEDRQALADLLASDLPLEVDLTRLDLTPPRAHEWLCQTLVRARLHGLSLAIPIRGEDAKSVCKALKRSRITLLRLHPYLTDTVDRVRPYALDILPILVKCIPAMPRLEDLEVSCQSGQEEFSIAVIRAAARCRWLQRLHIRLIEHPPLMDEILADFVAAKTSLESVTITYAESTADMHLPSTLRLPAVLNVVQSSFSACHLCVENSPDPITNDFARNVATVARLNRAGRAYVKFAPGDKAKGCRLLEKVMDDLDCLYFHLRENPMLCERAIGP